MLGTKKIKQLFRKKDKEILQQITLKIPRDFREMTLVEKTKHYPIQDRMPQKAFINNEKAIIGIRHTNHYLATSQLEDYQQDTIDAVFDAPSINDYQSKIITTKKASYILATYTLRTEEPTFMINLIGSHKNLMLLINFSCPASIQSVWAEKIQAIFKAVKLTKGEPTQ